MVDTFVNVNLEPGPGVDARFLFPGSTDAESTAAGLSGNSAQYNFKDARTGTSYFIEYVGNNFNFTNVGFVNLGGNISSEKLYKLNPDGSYNEVASLSITDANGNPVTVAMSSAADFTQNTPQNVDFTKVAQLSETGDTGADKLYGSAYDDTLSGYGGHDTLTGEDGNDRFEFISAGTSTYDFVTDFTHGHDKLVLDTDLRNFGSDIHNNNLANVFHDITTSPEKAGDRLIYNHNNGHLSYDPDGSGSKAAQLIAVLTNHAAVTYSDFRVV